MYSGYLKMFYKKYPDNKYLPYKEQYDSLLRDTSEPVGSYARMFNLQGVETACVITNADYLQEKWKLENGFVSLNNKTLVLEQVRKFKPDVLWIEGKDFIERKWTDRVRQSLPFLKLIVGNHCAPYDFKMLENFRHLDFIFTCTPGLKQDLEKNGLKTYLIYHAFDNAIIDKLKDDNSFSEKDFVFSGSLFIGGGFHDKRIEFLENILNGDGLM